MVTNMKYTQILKLQKTILHKTIMLNFRMTHTAGKNNCKCMACVEIVSVIIAFVSPCYCSSIDISDSSDSRRLYLPNMSIHCCSDSDL